jgi:hypothetical protein
MAEHRLWATFPPTYRQDEMKALAHWIAARVGGSVVGLPGCGRSNLLGFLCHRPRVLQSYLPPQAARVAVVPVDLNNLPTTDLSTLYRVLLRSLYRVHGRFDQALQEKITRLYLENQDRQDPFLPQSALQEALLAFQDAQMPLFLVLNHFDRFFETATFQMLNTLRGLRDSFKSTLFFIAGMCQEVAYLSDPGRLGEMYELLDSHVCWVGTMKEADARFLIADNTRVAPRPPSEAEIDAMLRLTGSFPSLLKAVCYWWLNTPDRPPVGEWLPVLNLEHSLEYRLAKVWNGLTQEEQFTLSLVLQLQDQGAKEPCRSTQALVEQRQPVLSRLLTKGVCRPTELGQYTVSELLSAYARRVGPAGRGKVWVHEKTQEIYQGVTPLRNLAPLEENLLRFLIRRPYARHTKTALIANTWPEQARVTIIDNDLQQLVVGLRKKIDLKPPRYVVTWTGNPEGGYQFYPEGRPE